MSPLEELHDFRRFLDDKIAQGVTDLTPALAVEEWALQFADEEEAEVVREVEEALADMAAGDTGIPIEDFRRELRAKHGLRSPAP